MIQTGTTERRAFNYWLRTGRQLASPAEPPVEFKFNPYHDPRNGQFTFAPGGPRSLDRVVISKRREQARPVRTREREARGETSDADATPFTAPAVYRSGIDDSKLEQASSGNRPPPQRGSNSAAFRDPMTLEQVFPGLRGAPDGSILALADNVFDFSGPAQELTSELALNRINALIRQIQAVNPAYRFETLGFPQTSGGQTNQMNALRFERAATLFRARDELRPLQVETLRELQKLTDQAYDRGVRLLKEGRLSVPISERLTLGNYVDTEVRRELRSKYHMARIQSAGAGPVRVNRRENDDSGSETTYRRPDARVGNIAFDVTLELKTLKTDQIKGFFATGFRPSHVVIVRPTQIGKGSSYIITRPETK